MAESQTQGPGIEFDAVVFREPRMEDPLALRIDIMVRARGEERVQVERPGDPAAVPRTVAKAAFDIADRLFVQVYQAVGKALNGSAVTNEPEHPSMKLRREIADLRKELEDITNRMSVAETQRDELRRIFQPETTISGLPISEPIMTGRDS